MKTYIFAAVLGLALINSANVFAEDSKYYPSQRPVQPDNSQYLGRIENGQQKNFQPAPKPQENPLKSLPVQPGYENGRVTATVTRSF